MRVSTLQVLWHDKKPVFSVDFNKEGELVTCGADKEVRLWRITEKAKGTQGSQGNEKGTTTAPGGAEPEVGVEYLCNLSAHSKGVNVVRFSPDGNTIVSAGDSGEVVVWRKRPGAGGSLGRDGTKAATPSKGGPDQAADPWAQDSAWKAVGTLRGQTDDVQDLAWSPDGSALVTGSVENVAIMWDATRHKHLARLDGHHHYVQGVAWDPKGEFVVTQSADRSCRVYAPKPQKQKRRRKQDQQQDAAKPKPSTCASRIQSAGGVALNGVLSRLQAAGQQDAGKSKAEPDAKASGEATKPEPQPQNQQQEQEQQQEGAKKRPRAEAAQSHFLFHDETMPSFFRRLSFSPCGSILACPAGVHRAVGGSSKRQRNCVHVYARGQWQRPLCTLPQLGKAVVAVKFCPVLFEKVEEQEQELQPEEEEESLVSSSQDEEMSLSEDEGVEAAQAAGEAEAEESLASSSEEEEESEEGEEGAAVVNKPRRRQLDLPHALYFAVLTLDCVVVYRANDMRPCKLISGLHCASLTDLAWSRCGTKMAVSSHDGYCSIISFDEGELGTPLPEKEEEPEATEARPEAEAAKGPTASAPAPLPQKSEIARDPVTNAQRKRIAPMPIR